VDQGLKEQYAEAALARDIGLAIKAELAARRGSGARAEKWDGETEAMRTGAEEKLWEFDEDTEKKRDGIEKRHAHGMEDFENLWREEMPPRYRRPSNQLLQLKAVEKSLAVAGQFEQAEAVHREAESLMAGEHRDCQQRLVLDYRAARARKQTKCSEELLNFASRRAVLRRGLEGERLVEIARADVRKLVRDQSKESGRPPRETGDDIRRREICRASLSSTYQARGAARRNPMPDLSPPNIEEFEARDRQRMAEKRRVQREFQEKHAKSVLAEWAPVEEEEEEEGEDSRSEWREAEQQGGQPQVGQPQGGQPQGGQPQGGQPQGGQPQGGQPQGGQPQGGQQQSGQQQASGSGRQGQKELPVLALGIIEAADFPRRGDEGTVDTCVKVRIGEDERQTKTCRDTVRPVWKEVFQWRITSADVLTMELWDVARGESMGTTEVDVVQMGDGQYFDSWVQLMPTGVQLHVLLKLDGDASVFLQPAIAVDIGSVAGAVADAVGAPSHGS
jgi:hypothetical protein